MLALLPNNDVLLSPPNNDVLLSPPLPNNDVLLSPPNNDVLLSPPLPNNDVDGLVSPVLLNKLFYCLFDYLIDAAFYAALISL